MALERTILVCGVITLTLAMAVIAPAETSKPAVPRDMPGCASRADVVARLAGTYGESLRITGLGLHNTVVEVFANPSSGNWTLTTTRPDGLTCLLTSGHAFETPVTRPPTRKTDRDKGI